MSILLAPASVAAAWVVSGRQRAGVTPSGGLIARASTKHSMISGGGFAVPAAVVPRPGRFSVTGQALP